jgi:hypothetical protein
MVTRRIGGLLSGGAMSVALPGCGGVDVADCTALTEALQPTRGIAPPESDPGGEIVAGIRAVAEEIPGGDLQSAAHGLADEWERYFELRESGDNHALPEFDFDPMSRHGETVDSICDPLVQEGTEQRLGESGRFRFGETSIRWPTVFFPKIGFASGMTVRDVPDESTPRGNHVGKPKPAEELGESQFRRVRIGVPRPPANRRTGTPNHLLTHI